MNGILAGIKKYKINKYLRTGLIIIFILISLTMLFLLLYTQKYQKYVEKKYPLLSYSNKGSVNYNVFLVPNMLYTQKSLEAGGIYITDFIDYINTSFKYEFNSESPVDIQGKYYVSAVVEGTLQDEKTSRSLWKKEFILQPETTFEGRGKALSFQKELPVKLTSFNDFVSQLAKVTSINCDTKLTIAWNIDMQGKTGKETINEHLSPTMEIPLGVRYFEIKGNQVQDKKGAVEETRKVISPSYQKKIILYSCVMGVCLITLIFLLFFTSAFVITDPLQKKLKQIFKHHGSRLAALKDNIDLTNKDMIYTASIDDLVRIADDLGKTILYKNSNNTKEAAVFYVIDDRLIYILELDEDNEIPNTTITEEVQQKSVEIKV